MNDDTDVKMEIPDHLLIDRLPERLFDLDEAKDCELWDIDRHPVTFGSLLPEKNACVIFVFIRHFLDYATREYVEDFSKIFPHALQESRVKIVLIGCAPARYIRQFVEDTSCPHEVYCDSKRILHKLMALHEVAMETPSSGSPHVKTNSFVGFWQTVWRAMTSQSEQGSQFQMGGQLVIDGEERILFFHRDRHALDHTPINHLLAVAGLPRIDFCTKYRIKHV